MIIQINEVAKQAAIQSYQDNQNDFIDQVLGGNLISTQSFDEQLKDALNVFAFHGKGKELVKKSIQDLSDNYEKFTQKVDRNGTAKPIKKKKSTQGGPTDSKCATFGLKEILTLLKNNGLPTDIGDPTLDNYAVRIYFGQHGDNTAITASNETTITDIPTNYQRQLTVILVTAEKDGGIYKDNLTAKQGLNPSIAIPLGPPPQLGGFGLEVASLCPPDCGGGEGIE